MASRKEQAPEPHAQRGPAVVRGVAAGLFGFLAAGLVEAAVLPLSVNPFAAGVGSALLALVHLLGVVGLVGFLGGAGLALLMPSLDAALGPLLSPARSRELQAEQLVLASASGVAAVLCGGLPVLAVLGWGGASHAFRRTELVGPYLALVVGVAVALAFVLYFPFRAGVRALVARVLPGGRLGSWPLPVILLASALALTAGAIFALTAGAELGGFRFGPVLVALVALAASVVLWYRGALLQRTAVFAPAALLVGVAALLAIFGLDASPTSATILPSQGLLSQLSIQALRAVFDFDHDGYASLLGGGDCDPYDPEINPGARDVPGNSIDENCAGGDATLIDPADAGRLERAPVVAPRPLAIVLLMIDTVRPDHMGLYGYARPTTPNLDRWAKGAVVFDKVYAQAPNTPRSLPSLLTGRYPSRIGWQARFANFSDVAPESELLFDVFARAGFRTEAVTAHWYFDQVPTLRRSVQRWDNHGTEHVKQSYDAMVEPDVTRRGLERLDALAADPARPFVLFVHYFAPHARYLPHPELPSFGSSPLDLYDGEIAYVDHHIEALLARLDQPDLRDRTVVAIFGDHGESLGEHGLELHGRTVFEAELRVPLMLRVPGYSPLRVKTPVALIDLFPTLAELTGLHASRAQGRSLVPLMLGQGAWPERLIFLEQIPYTSHAVHIVGAVAPDGRKLVRDVTHNVTTLFDLGTDPSERRPLVPEPSRDARLIEQLSAFLEADPGAELSPP